MVLKALLTTAVSCLNAERFYPSNGREEKMPSSELRKTSTATRHQLEQIVKLKTHLGIPIGDIWSYTEWQAHNIIQLLKAYKLAVD